MSAGTECRYTSVAATSKGLKWLSFLVTIKPLYISTNPKPQHTLSLQMHRNDDQTI